MSHVSARLSHVAQGTFTNVNQRTPRQTVVCLISRWQRRTQDFLKGRGGGGAIFSCIVASRVRKINFT